jgi:peptidoglycan/LPS O-acetylase OafA/YrhL
MVFPALWMTFGFLAKHAIPGRRFGLFGFILLLYLYLAFISWRFSSTVKRIPTKNENILIMIFTCLWTMVFESISLFSIFKSNSNNIPIRFDLFLISLSFGIVIDAMVIYGSVFFTLPKMIRYVMGIENRNSA